MAFETFKRQRVPIGGQPAVTFQRRGTVSLNRAAYDALGEPTTVELLFDRERKLMALNKVATDTAHAYPVRPFGKGNTFLVSGKAFMKFYGIEIGPARRWIGKPEPDGLLVVDLNEDPLEIAGNRASERSP
jgi:hypothetical protein